MSHYSNLFNKVPIEVPNRNGFDLSHENYFSGTTGTLIPIMVDEILPNDSISLGAMCNVQLPPMVSDFFGRIDFVMEAFFVPNRVLWGGWQDFISNQQNGVNTGSTNSPTQLPWLQIVSTSSTGSIPLLLDYLGYKSATGIASGVGAIAYNALPVAAYHKIFSDWYRNPFIQKDIYSRDYDSNIPSSLAAKTLPYRSFTILGSSSNYQIVNTTFNDGVSFTSLRQRNWAKDYFTTATPKPQAGEASSLTFTTETDTSTGEGTGSFTIASLRAANSLQQFLERSNISGYRYGDLIKAHFGIYPSDAVTDRSIYLGRKVVSVYNQSVAAAINQEENWSPGGSKVNPFSQFQGATTARSMAIGDGTLCDKFTATEHGFLMVIGSLVPHVNYSTGCRRMFARSKIGDFAFPLLQGVGDQPIFCWELSPFMSPSFNESIETNAIFGYTQRYGEYKYMDDEVHGELSDYRGNGTSQNMGSLKNFVLQKSYNISEPINTDFIQIPTDYLDQVTAVTSSSAKCSYWADVYFSYKKVSTLSAYVIPTLGDLRNVHTEVIDKGGKML